MIEKNAIDITKDIFFNMFKENEDVLRQEYEYCGKFDLYSCFAFMNYDSIYKNIQGAFDNINHIMSIYRKAKQDNDGMLVNTTIIKIGNHMMLLSDFIDGFRFCISNSDLLPFWTKPTSDYKIPKEYFKELKGKKAVEQLYKDVFNGENIFNYIQLELLTLLKRTMLDINVTPRNLLIYRGDDNLDNYIKRHLEMLMDFSDIFNKASANSDNLCMCMALRYMFYSLEATSVFFYLLQNDIYRLKHFVKKLKYIEDRKTREEYGFK
jgi:hypothetical protein